MSRKVQVLVNLEVPDVLTDAQLVQFTTEAVCDYADTLPYAQPVEVGEVITLPYWGEVQSLKVEHTGGNVFQTRLTLTDGSLLMVTTDNVLLYPSEADADAEHEDPWAFPRIDRY